MGVWVRVFARVNVIVCVCKMQCVFFFRGHPSWFSLSLFHVLDHSLTRSPIHSFIHFSLSPLLPSISDPITQSNEGEIECVFGYMCVCVYVYVCVVCVWERVLSGAESWKFRGFVDSSSSSFFDTPLSFFWRCFVTVGGLLLFGFSFFLFFFLHCVWGFIVWHFSVR